MSDEKTRHDVRDALLNYLDTDTIWYVSPLRTDLSPTYHFE